MSISEDVCSSHTSELTCGPSKRVVVFGAIQAIEGGCRSHLSEMYRKTFSVTDNTDSKFGGAPGRAVHFTGRHARRPARALKQCTTGKAT